MPLGSFIYTSGTTGRPRAVKREPPTPEQVERSNRMVAQAFGLGATGGPSEITTVMTGPLYHSAPNAYGLALARSGATVVLQPRFDAQSLLSLIARHRVTHMHVVPVMFKRLLLLTAEERSRHNVSSLKWVVHGAAPCPADLKREMIDWWGPVLYEYYGATETGLITLASSADWLERPGTVGRAASGVTLRVLDEVGKDCPPGVVGEIACRNEDVGNFTYYGDDEKRRRVDRDGLIFLGDIGYLDQEGFLFLCDRAADVINSGGVNIYPAEIESVIQLMPGVADCVAFGIPDDEFGEAVCAAIQLREGELSSVESVTAFLNGKMAHYKIPKRIEFHENLPREDSGKIFRRKLRERHWAGLSRQI
jgi:long-chain acyl-CoA synthetase